MDEKELYAITLVKMYGCLSRMGEGKKQNKRQVFVLWKLVGKTSTECGRFHDKAIADGVLEQYQKLHPCYQYQVTKAGETPIWS